MISGMRALGLRVPDGLHAWLADIANREHRSVNAQVIVILERARAEDEAAQKPKRDKN